MYTWLTTSPKGPFKANTNQMETNIANKQSILKIQIFLSRPVTIYKVQANSSN